MTDIFYSAKINKSICAAYISTVQTEQAMNLLTFKFVGLGLDWQQEI